MRQPAYWIAPDGEIIPVPDRHIAEMKRHPERFGTTEEEIRAVYQAHGQPIGLDGTAARELKEAAIRRGWIRIRWYRDGWSVNVPAWNDDTRRRILLWARHIQEKQEYILDPIRVDTTGEEDRVFDNTSSLIDFLSAR